MQFSSYELHRYIYIYLYTTTKKSISWHRNGGRPYRQER